jgi:putative SOS response-associated peptidase YedK
MYDRYAIHTPASKIREELAVEVPEAYLPSYNAAPTQLLPVITSQDRRGISFFHWGLMAKWSNNKSISAKSINLPAQTAFQKTSYRNQLMTHRCIIPISGFYAWKRVSKKQVVPYYFYPTKVPMLGIAGIWEEFEDIDGSVSHSFIILTVDSSSALSEIEDQMPAFMEPMACIKWLQSNDLEELHGLVDVITDHHSALASHSVSPMITDLKNNSAQLIKSVPASDQHGNYTLFS